MIWVQIGGTHGNGGTKEFIEEHRIFPITAPSEAPYDAANYPRRVRHVLRLGGHLLVAHGWRRLRRRRAWC
jgi:hypothetical protein